MTNSTSKESLLKQHLQSFQQIPTNNIYTRKPQESASSKQKMPRPILPPITHKGQERYEWKCLHDSYMWTLARTYSVKDMRRCIRNRYMDILLREGSKGFHSPHTIQAYAGSISAALYKDSRMIEKSKTPDKFDILFKRKSKSHSTDTEGGATSDNNNYSKLNSSQNSSIVRTNARRQIPRINQQHTGKGNSETNVLKPKPLENCPLPEKGTTGRRRKGRGNFDRGKSQIEKEQGSEKEEMEGQTTGKEEDNLTNTSNSNQPVEKTNNRTNFPRGISERNPNKNKGRKRTAKDETVTVDVEEEKHQPRDDSKVNDYSAKDKIAGKKDVNTRENIKQTKRKEKLKKKSNKNTEVLRKSSKTVDSQLPEYSKQNDDADPDIKNTQTGKNDMNNEETVDNYSNSNEEKNKESMVRQSPVDVNVNKQSEVVSVNESNAEGKDDSGNADNFSNNTEKEESKSEVTNDPIIDTTSADVNKTDQENVKTSEEEKHTSDNEDMKSETSRDNVNATHTSDRFSPQKSNEKVDDVSESSTVDLKQTPELKTRESNENININQEKEQEQFPVDNEPNSVERKSDSILERNTPKKYTETDEENGETLDNSPSLHNTSVDDDDGDDVNRLAAYQKEVINDVQERDNETKTKDAGGDTDMNEMELTAENLTDDIDVTDAAKTDNENGRSDSNLPDKIIAKDSMSENVITNAEQPTEETSTAAEVIDSDSNVSRDVNIDNNASKHSDDNAVSDTDTINNNTNTVVDEGVDTKAVDDGNISHQTDKDLVTDISEDTAVTGDIQNSNDLGDVTPDSVSLVRSNVNSDKARRDSLQENDVPSHFNSEDGVENETNDIEKNFNDGSRNTRNDEYNEDSSNEIPNNVPQKPIADSNKETSDINANNGQNSQSKEQKNISNGESVDNFIDDRYETLNPSVNNGNRLEDNSPAMTSFVENNDRKSGETSKMDESDNILNADVENTENDDVTYSKNGNFQNENVGGIEVLSDTARDKSGTPDVLDNSNDSLRIADTEDNTQNINEDKTSLREKNDIRTEKTELDNMTSDCEGFVAADSKTQDQHSSSCVEERDNDENNDGDVDGDGHRRDDDAVDDDNGKGGDVTERSRETISLTRDNNETNDDVNIAEDGSTEPDVGDSVEVKPSNDGDVQNTRTNSESTIKDVIYSNGSPTEGGEANGSTVNVAETIAANTDDNTVKRRDSRDGGGNDVSQEVSMSIDEDGNVNKVTGSTTLAGDVNKDAVVEKNAIEDNVSNGESDVTGKATDNDSINTASVGIIDSATTDNIADKTEFSTVDEDDTNATSEVTESNPVDGDTNLLASGVTKTTPGDENVNNDVMKVTDSHNVDSDEAYADKRVTDSNTEHNSDNDKSTENMNSTAKDEDGNLVPPIITDRNNGDGETNVSAEEDMQNAKEVSDVNNAVENEGSSSDDKNIG
ncbi:protein PFC0760c-like isoform X2 [Octopus sinensis]|uniref:Protein PFC0760c-like isoform X2 n=1 Tax=Octopus sinensis TaxID=2607531 RepID=A0A6P7STL2_9MOLL|nr:protein PFC0760c-like isoform X2 [Octopus sinensis]